MTMQRVWRLTGVALALLLLVACGDELQFYPDRVYSEETFCSEACAEARREARCDSFWEAVPDNGIEECIRATPCEGGFGCPGDSLWDPQCYIDCVRMEPEAVRSAVADALECEVPSPACE